MNTTATHKEIITLAQKLIKIRTVANNTTALNKTFLLCERLLQGYTIKKFSSHGKPSLLVHNAQPETKNFTIIFNAHLDVIEGDNVQFEPKIVDGKLYGRGAYDMKAASAVIILLFKEIAKTLPYTIALQLTTDEEKGSHCAQTQVDAGYRGTFIVTGECGSNFRITNQAKGVYHARLTATGTASHAGYPWRGKNAILKLITAINAITQKYPSPRDETWKTTVNVTRLHTINEATNRIPDHAQAHLDIRYTPDDAAILSDIVSLLPKEVTLATEAEYSPLKTKPDNKCLLLLQSACQNILKRPTELRNAHATSDIVRFAEVDCDGVEFGPIGGNQHTDNEWVDIQSLETYYHILKEFLLSVVV